MSAIRHVVWDFNGTLLDDVDICVATLNTMLAERALPALSRPQYLESFGFPVYDFYLALGFDFEREDFTTVSHTYITRYEARVGEAVPHDEAKAAIAAVRRRGVTQAVLSAMEHSLLERLLARFELRAAMAEVRGLPDHGASSKVELGRVLQRELGANADEILLVGDTLHDAEVARALGCRCLLYTRGHQERSRLLAAGLPLCDSLADVAGLLEPSAWP